MENACASAATTLCGVAGTVIFQTDGIAVGILATVRVTVGTGA